MGAKRDVGFYWAFLLVTLITFLPFKSIGFIIPSLFWCVMLLGIGDAEMVKKSVLLAIACGILIGVYGIVLASEDRPYIPSNAILSVLNYSSFIVLLTIPAGVVSSEYTYEKYVKVLLPVTGVQGTVGILQRILSLASGIKHGDLVEGTIDPLSVITKTTSGFGNQFFAINMVFLLIFCFPYVFSRRKGFLPYSLGFLAVVLASVGHVFYSLTAAIVLSLIFLEGKRALMSPKLLFVVAIIPVVLVGAIAALDENMYNDASRQAKLFFNGETPKSKAIGIVFGELTHEYPSIHLVGLGPGHYSSRAGLISSGEYGALSDFFRGLPFFSLGMTEEFREFVLPAWNEYKENEGYGNSTMSRPFLSLLSVYSEYGGVVFVLCVLWIGHCAYSARSRYQSARKNNLDAEALLAFSYCIALLFLVGIGVYENYFEAPQGVFVGVLLLFVTGKLIARKGASVRELV